VLLRGLGIDKLTGTSEKKKREFIFMKCSKCKTEPLAAYTIEGVTVDRCAACDGVWFDAEELSQLLSEEARHVAQLLKGSVSTQADGKKAYCPRDASIMMRVYSSIDHSVILDVCGECRGVWLDGGEFDKLFAALRR
jgi:Zn-finger nucleic acid-binding protein